MDVRRVDGYSATIAGSVRSGTLRSSHVHGTLHSQSRRGEIELVGQSEVQSVAGIEVKGRSLDGAAVIGRVVEAIMRVAGGINAVVQRQVHGERSALAKEVQRVGDGSAGRGTRRTIAYLRRGH